MSLNKRLLPAGTTCALLAFVMFVGPAGAEPRLQPFASDGCSSFPDGPVLTNGGVDRQNLWRDCCVDHDRAYWRGGSYQERVAADESLQQCVEALGEPATARLMLLGVRVGGSPFWPTSYRWGYGWPYLRGYGSLATDVGAGAGACRDGGASVARCDHEPCIRPARAAELAQSNFEKVKPVGQSNK